MDTLFSHIANRSLAHAARFSGTPQHFPESVAEHSFYTAYITMFLCDLLRQVDHPIDKEKAVSMALIHDAEEMFSGDILTPFKHYSEEVAEAIRHVNKEAIHKNVFEDLPDSLKSNAVELWEEESARLTTEAQVVRVADRISLVAKCAEEVHVGNAYFDDIYENQLNELKELDMTWWNKIKDKVIG